MPGQPNPRLHPRMGFFSHPKSIQNYCPLKNSGICSTIIQASSRKRAQEPVLNLWATNSLRSGGIQLLSQSSPRLFAAASGHFCLWPLPTPSQRSDQISLNHFESFTPDAFYVGCCHFSTLRYKGKEVSVERVKHCRF